MNKWLLGIALVLVTVVSTAGYLLFQYRNLRLAFIVVYNKGKKITLDQSSPYLPQLQATCEEMLKSGKFFPLKVQPHPEEIRNKEWAIELTYPKPQHFKLLTGESLEVLQLLIPLTGSATQIESDGKKLTYLFPFPEDIDSPGTVSEHWSGPIVTEREVGHIKEQLLNFNIAIP